jgi:hypothetical protein
MVEIKMTGLKGDIAEKENQEPIADHVITMEPELNLSFFRVLFTFNRNSFCQTSLVICIHETVGLWRVDIVTVILCGCEIWCLTSRKEDGLRVCDSRVVRRRFGVRGGRNRGM